jgi:predicted SnoaL-like aldol condensation-catalyzing enzyme
VTGSSTSSKESRPPCAISRDFAADGDFVIVHGRFSGFGAPVNWIAADILRIEDGILVEHWDVIQDEVTEEQSKSKAPMFGSTFPTYQCAARLFSQG